MSGTTVAIGCCVSYNIRFFLQLNQYSIFRDVLRLDPSVMDETIQETRLEVNKVGRMRHAIPR